MAAFVSHWDRLNIAPNTKIIRANEYRNYLDAQKLVDAAQTKGEALIEEAETKAASIVENAEEKYQERSEEGYADGLAALRQQQAEGVLDAGFERLLYFGSMEEQMVQIVTSCVKRIHESIPPADRIISQVKRALKDSGRGKEMIIWVSKADVDRVDADVHQMLQAFDAVNTIDVKSKPELQDGDCILESEWGSVDASIEVQLKALETSLKRNLSQNSKKPAETPDEPSTEI